MVPQIRIQPCNQTPVRPDGDYVLYWMTAFRRVEWNFGLQRAVEWAQQLKKPLLIFEPLKSTYQWASDRLHSFVIDGMAANATRVAATKNRGVLYYPYVEPTPGADKGLLAALAQQACAIVTDDFPSFFLPTLVRAAVAQLNVRLEKVDSNGLFPLRATERVFTTAFSFRAFLQKELPPHLLELPEPEPLRVTRLPTFASPPNDVLKRWPAASTSLLGQGRNLADLPIDHSVGVVGWRGGATEARSRLNRFLAKNLQSYVDSGNEPDTDARSGLSPYLHFGHISPHEVFHTLMQHESWTPAKLGKNTGGKREGWWGVTHDAEAWLDEFVTWRELGHNMSSHRRDCDRYESLPDWALATLKKHSRDRRSHVYELDEFAMAATHDPLWNAAQTQLVTEGRIHNYLRMLWGKKILEWSATPQDALATMIELNNRYALDGRNPNSYSGIFWVLGRYDRAWGPERPIFGTVRYMSSENTQRKLHVKNYLQTYGPRRDKQVPLKFE